MSIDETDDPSTGQQARSSTDEPGRLESPESHRGWQQRFEEGPFGQGIISGLIVITLIAIVAINLPGSRLRQDLLQPGQPYLNALGADQNWALFAPDPRRVVLGLSAEVSFEDGGRRVWQFPHDGALIGEYRDYRWRKWVEQVIAPVNGAALWRPAALWAAAREQRPGHSVTEVQLIERFHAINPPGVTPSFGPDFTRLVYTLHVGPAR